VIIGINGILTRLICDIKTVVLPKVGETMARDQFFAHVIQEKHIVPLIAPIDGVITAVNHELAKNPDSLLGSCPDKAWMVALKPHNLEHDLRTLVFGAQAVEWYRKKDRHILETVHEVYGTNGTGIGPTLQDGGDFMLNPSETLTPDQYYRILEVLSGTE
jgi:glycine cleavage system H lipoate-binding protein